LRHRLFATIVPALVRYALQRRTWTLSNAQIVLLGGIAGSTIFLGLPLGRLKNPSTAVRASLCALATGILVFLLVDVLQNAFAPVEEAVTDRHWSSFAGYGLLFAAGTAIGLLALVYYERWMGREQRKSMLGPGAASAAEFEANWVAGMSPGKWLALLIATGIGLHNFSEGLAIGQAGAAGELSLALLLIIGFGLHNATEGFGIVAPMSGERPSWKFLALLGLIGGGPTFLGTLVGQAWTSEALAVLFLALAAGSILYVVIQLVKVMQRQGHPLLVAWMIFAGLMLGFGTELVLKAAGV
jgi:ZIP family zinc transporter